MKPFSILLFILLFSNRLWALELSRDFTSTVDQESTELIWNIVEGVLLPPIQLRYNFATVPPAFEYLDLDPGDGRHGDFKLSTYSNFSENGDTSGNVIRINTDQYPKLQFTTFDLQDGWTLRPTGSQPLVIKVLGDMTIDGIIDCSGEDGEDLSSNVNQQAQGGIGICGGGNGGKGGSLTLNANDGSEGGASVTGGNAGPSTVLTMGQGGGGGGGYGDPFGGNDPKDGDDSTGSAGGLKGTQFTDHSFSELGGGSGGGGGSVFFNSAAEDSNGGGGGAGGGIIEIVVLGNVNIGLNGKILAKGGNGGGNNTGLRAGGGGGGAGGSVSLFAKGDVVNDGEISAVHGLGGVTNAANGGDGGDGGDGRTWVTDKDISVTGAGTINPISFLFSEGSVRYKVGTFTTESISFDLLNSRPEITDVTFSSVLQGGSTAMVELALSSQSNFTATTWEPVSALTQTPARYFKYRISLTNASATLPSSISGLSIQYEPYQEEKFEFSGGCGQVSTKPPTNVIYLITFLLLMPLIFLLILKYTLKFKS